MRRREDGFTLVEALVSVTVMGILMSAVATALGVFFTTSQETTERLAESPEAQVASTHLTRDVQGASVLTSRCAPSSWPAGGTELVSLGRRDPGTTTALADDKAVIVSYVVSTASGSTQKVLRRYECVDGTVLTTPGAAFPASVATASSASVLVAYVDPSTPVTAATTVTAVTVSFGICTSKPDVAQCRSSTSLPFKLTVGRRVA